MAKGKYERRKSSGLTLPHRRERKAAPEAETPPENPAENPTQKETFVPKPIMKVLGVVKNLVVWAITLAAVGMMIFTVLSVTTLNRSERSFLGYQAFIVLSDSMKATDFDAGDVVLVKSVDPDTLQPGDIISFRSQNSSSFGQTVTHKIRARTTDANGNPAFITYGTTTDTDDETPVPYANVLGKYQRSLKKLGYFFQFLRTGPGYILFILVPFGLLIAMQAIQSVRLFQQDKKEEMSQIQAERALLAAEREQTRQMLLELKRMQEQMQQTPPSEDPPKE